MADEQLTWQYLAVLLPLCVIFLCVGFYNFKYGWSEGFGTGQVVPNLDMSDRGQQQQQQQQLGEQRMRVLDRIFPAPAATEEGRIVLVYDVESKRYVAHTPDGVASPSCSICLENFGTLRYIALHCIALHCVC